MFDRDLLGICKHGREHFFFGADGDVYTRQESASGHAEGSWVMPLIVTEIEIGHHGHFASDSLFHCKEGGTATGFFVQRRARDLQTTKLANIGRNDVIDGHGSVGAVVAVIH